MFRLFGLFVEALPAQKMVLAHLPYIYYIPLTLLCKENKCLFFIQYSGEEIALKENIWHNTGIFHT